jgi:hypothetical protein
MHSVTLQSLRLRRRRGKFAQSTSSRSRRLRIESLEPRMCLSLTVPAFSSLPGANHTIYLDFDGHVTSGTTWNSGYYAEDPIVSPAWSLDSDRANFSSTELATIERIWQRVAEDFSPFKVNVTTVEPPVNDLRKGEVSGDTRWGVRAVVTIETTTVRCGCGGIAYIGNFNDLYDEPVFVYNSSENGVAEAISHEVGHSLYLSHDGNSTTEYYAGHGSGATSWAPIMGNSYNRSVTTFDRGEYYGSNNGGSNANYGRGPDDLQVIATYNGFGLRADEHGNSNATATPLTVSGTSVSGQGIISTRTDVDVLSFATGAGNVTLNINPASFRPNLDIKADLYDSAGALVASSNPSTALNASFNLSLPAGQYYLHIDGVGFGDPTVSPPTGYTDYASIGQYTISGTIIDSGSLPSLTINDVSVDEAAGVATFTVLRSGNISGTVTVSYSTADGAGSDGAVAPADYAAKSGSLTFLPGETSQQIQISIVNDSLAEPDEFFYVNLSGASGAIIADPQGVGTIRNDDAAVSIDDVSGKEGNANKKNASLTNFNFTVSLQYAVPYAVTVQYATGAGGDTATAGVDYQSKSGSVTIAAGQTSAIVAITVIGDNNVEPDETFSVKLSTTNSSITLVDAIGTGTILDDDSGGKGSGKPGKSQGQPDFTIIDHVDMAEPHDHHDHSHHSHSHHVHSSPSHVESSFVVSRNLDVSRNDVHVAAGGQQQRVVANDTALRSLFAPLTDQAWLGNRTAAHSALSVSPSVRLASSPTRLSAVNADLIFAARSQTRADEVEIDVELPQTSQRDHSGDNSQDEFIFTDDWDLALDAILTPHAG